MNYKTFWTAARLSGQNGSGRDLFTLKPGFGPFEPAFSEKRVVGL
jgi:hypothetical protein